ncbi:hypothetical protein K1719_002902 [Acacia pycnantha]|nr:hypothetical protein K1719_002902 [Acacia pycnantha]
MQTFVLGCFRNTNSPRKEVDSDDDGVGGSDFETGHDQLKSPTFSRLISGTCCGVWTYFGNMEMLQHGPYK